MGLMLLVNYADVTLLQVVQSGARFVALDFTMKRLGVAVAIVVIRVHVWQLVLDNLISYVRLLQSI